MNLLGVEIDAVTEAELLAQVEEALERGEGGWIVTPNLDILRKASLNPECGRLVREATSVVADGMPLIWASRLQKTPLPERVAGADLVWSMCALAARRGWPIFFLGGPPGVADSAAERFRATHPDLEVAGVLSPPYGFERVPGSTEQICREVRGSSAQVVLIGLGFPKQEKLIRELRTTCPDTWFLGIGNALSFVAGRSRAPAWMRATGLEWAHRLAQEPRRLARRYLVDGLPFAARLMIRSAWSGRRLR